MVEGASSLQKLFFPLSFKGEGDTGGEVENIPQREKELGSEVKNAVSSCSYG